MKNSDLNNLSLMELGWRHAFQQQISFEQLELGFAARVDAVFRDRIHLCSEKGDLTVLITGLLKSDDSESRVVTGDWLWLENDTNKPLKILQRENLLKRTAAGSEPITQLIAANIDTLFIVSSCNQDFNLSRLERYVTLAMSAGIPAVIVLTKADLTTESDSYAQQAEGIHLSVPVILVNALSADINERFADWTRVGQTIAFLGSSGVGKSTLTNSLLGKQVQDTAGIREDDAKGRHTTTDRSMHKMPNRGWVLDTPGMRELRLNDDHQGVSDLFADIEALALQCKFSNCHHNGDKGCAIEAALDNGTLDRRRWNNYRKLMSEAEFASQTKQERLKQKEKWGKEVSKLIKKHKKLSKP